MRDQVSKKLPIVSFAIVVFNEGSRIKRCLDAITAQNYPKDKVEIIIIDGGSTDETIKIAKKFPAKIYYNEKRFAEPGLAKAYQKASGDYMVFMAADNIIFDTNWTRKMVQPFLDDPGKILAAFSKVVNDPKDNAWNKYLNEDTDPFSAFVFGNASHPDKLRYMYNIHIETNNYILYDFPSKDFPLIALAQCTIVKTKLPRKEDSEFDDILPLIRLVETGGKIAFVKNTGIYHYSVTNFSNLCSKFKKRIYNSMKTKSYTSREAYVSNVRKLRRYLFLLYSLTVLGPLCEGIIQTLRKGKVYILLHPVVSFIMGYYILYSFIRMKIWRK